MKSLIALSLLVIVASVAPAQAFLAPSNPPPVVQLAWNASPSSGISNYFVYYGLGSGQYTSKIIAGNSTSITLTLPARGQTYYFSVTAQTGGGLESVFSDEVFFTPANPPLPPALKPVVVLTVQSKPIDPPDALWADAGMNWSLPQDAFGQMFRLELAANNPQSVLVPQPLVRRAPPMPGVK